MTHRWIDYLYILATILLTVFGQLVLKWRMDQVGPMPPGVIDGMRFLIGLLIDPLVMASYLSALLAGLAWMAAMTRFELSYAYPFTSLSFVVVLALSVWLLGEALTVSKVVGIVLIVAGTIVASVRPG